jgi:TolB-like protein
MPKSISDAISAVMALISVAVAGLPATAVAQDRPAIAVYSVSDPSQTGLDEELREQLEMALASTTRFDVVIRDAARIEPATNAAGASSARPVAYVLSGSINFAEKRTSAAAQMVDAMVGTACGADEYNVGIDVVLTDIRTGQVIHTDTLRDTAKLRCNQGGEGEGYLLATQAVARKAANNLALTFYPITVVIARPDGSIVLDYGEAVLPVGTFLQIFGPDETAVVGGQALTISGPFLGRIKVTEATARTAMARSEGKDKLVIPPGAIARIDNDQSPPRQTKGR